MRATRPTAILFPAIARFMSPGPSPQITASPAISGRWDNTKPGTVGAKDRFIGNGGVGDLAVPFVCVFRQPDEGQGQRCGAGLHVAHAEAGQPAVDRLHFVERHRPVLFALQGSLYRDDR